MHLPCLRLTPSCLHTPRFLACAPVILAAGAFWIGFALNGIFAAAGVFPPPAHDGEKMLLSLWGILTFFFFCASLTVNLVLQASVQLGGTTVRASERGAGPCMPQVGPAAADEQGCCCHCHSLHPPPAPLHPPSAQWRLVPSPPLLAWVPSGPRSGGDAGEGGPGGLTLAQACRPPFHSLAQPAGPVPPAIYRILPSRWRRVQP